MKKYEYSLHDIRFEKLQEELEFFSKFKVYDNKFIYKFDIESEEYSTDAVMDMMHDSLGEYIIHLNLLGPYLSDEAYEELEKQGLFNPDGRTLDGFYNFYNIGATSSTEYLGAIKNGLQYAKDGKGKLTNEELQNQFIPWNTPERAIKGGAVFIGSSYILVRTKLLIFTKV